MPLPNRGLTMRAQHLMVLGVILLLAGCEPSAALPFVSKRTSMVIEIEAAGNINPATGRASPLVLKLYQLQSPAVFNQVDFLALLMPMNAR